MGFGGGDGDKKNGDRKDNALARRNKIISHFHKINYQDSSQQIFDSNQEDYGIRTF